MNQKGGKEMLKYLVVLSLVVSLLVQSCGPSRVLVKRGKTKVVIAETIPRIREPKWVESTKEFWEKKDSYFYRGMSQGYTDPEVSRRDAEAVARASLARQVKVVLRDEFRRALEAQKQDPTIGGYLSDSFVSIVENLEITGSVFVDSYSQRIQEISYKSVLRDYWRTYAKVELPRGEYEKCAKRAFENLKVQVEANESAEDLAEKTEKRFWEQQELKRL